MVGSLQQTHGKAGRGAKCSSTVGLLNRLPTDTPTAPDPAAISDLQTAARQERDAMRVVLNSLGIGFFDWDLLAKEVWYSSHVHALLDYTAEDAAAMDNVFRTLIHPEDEANAQAQQDALLAGEIDEYRCEFRVRHKDARWVWIEATGRIVVHAQDGTPLRFAGMFNGIDARRQAQADAEFLNNLTVALLQERDADAIKRIAIRKLGVYLGADRVSFGRLSGRRESLVVDMDWLGARVPPLTGEWKASGCKPTIEYVTTHRTPIVIRDAHDDPVITDDETRGLFAMTETRAAIAVPLIVDGDVRALLIVSHSTPRNWQEHEVELVKTVAMRVWDSVLRARAQEMSRADKALLQLALKMAKLAARERDARTGSARLSDNFFAVVGHPDVDYMTVDEFVSHVHPEDRDAFEKKVLANGDLSGVGTIAHEFRMITADEQIRHIGMMGEFFVPSGKSGEGSAHSAAIFQDITEHKERELAARQAQDQLLKQSRLSAMGVMASTLAHELNQPLATAANYLGLIQAKAGDFALAEELRDYVDRVMAKVLEAGQIIRRIRSFTADGEVNTSPQSLRSLVYQALSGLFGAAGAQNLAVINAVPDNLIVEAEPLLIEHAVANLVRNAVDALGDKADGYIRISAQVRHGMAELLIADNGPGMTDEVAASVFSPFVTTKPQGTGLGLPLCRTMVEANGGRISLREYGPDGVLFCITLPLADQAEQHNHTKEKNGGSPKSTHC